MKRPQITPELTAALERARIVAWLREKSELSDEQFYSAFGYAADEIEKGAHLSPPPGKIIEEM